MMIAERMAPAPPLRQWNLEISPAVESIVHRCLHADPAYRYRSASELHEDLRRQLDDLPLKHAPEPSVRERLGKWARRHRRLTSMTTLVLVAAGLLAVVTACFLARQRHLARLEARDASNRLGAEAAPARLPAWRPRRAARADRGRDGPLPPHPGALPRPRRPGVDGSAAVALLPPDERDRRRREIGHLLLIDARASIWQAESTKDPAQRSGRLELATLLNGRAGVAMGDAAPSRALLLQQSDLARLAGREGEAGRLREQAEAFPPQTPVDRYWDVLDRIEHRGRPGDPTATRQREEIMATLQDISRGDLQNFVN